MPLPAAIEKVGRCLVFLRVRRTDGSEGHGSGFVVGAGGEIATAAHILRDAREVEAAIVGVKGGVRPAQILATDAAADTALVKVEARDLAAVTLARSPAELGADVALMGFPHSDIFDPPLVMTMRGIVGNRYRLGTVDHYVLDASPSEGMSGGPVFLATTGDVVGLLGGRFDPGRTRGKLRGLTREAVRDLPVERTSICFAPVIEHVAALLGKGRGGR